MALALVCALTIIRPLGAQAQTLQTLFVFGLGPTPQGATNPDAQLVLDSQGNIYGTTVLGGLYNRGTVYELPEDGSLKVIHNINPEQDGITPMAPLIVDSQGNLYTTLSGGLGTYGTVIELTPNSNGTWTESTLHVFSDSDGSSPSSAPLLESGALYGTTPFGGSNSYGVAYSISDDSDHLFNVIHTFDSTSGRPSGALIADAHGNLYGMTDYSSNHYGRVFMLTPLPVGTWTYTVLYSFQGAPTDSDTPSGSLIFDAAGNLYGVTTFGGSSFLGTVFKLSPNPNGTWTESVLYSFPGGMGGAEPDGPLTLGPDGSLYGTTTGASAPSFAFQLTPASGGQWTYSNLVRFGNPYLFGGMNLDSAGNLYGIYSGSQAEIFKLTP